MRFLQDDLPIDAPLTPRALSSYLGSSGWSLDFSSESSQVWSLPSEDARILLPYDRGFEDFDIRMHQALKLLCDINDWDPYQLTSQILGVRSDFLYIRADQVITDASIPLSEAQSLLDGARNMLWAAACSAIRPKARHVGRRPDGATQFVENDVRMGHTLRGSFIITILTRLDLDQPPQPEQEHTDSTVAGTEPDLAVPESGEDTLGPEEPLINIPFQRRAMVALAEGLSATRQIVGGEEEVSLERAVDKGLSADLVEALESMTQHVGLHALDLSFDWGKSEPRLRPAVENVVIEQSVRSELSAVVRRLEKEQPEPQTVTIYGQVTRLERGEEDESGYVTVRGVIGASTRQQVRVELSGRDYNTALQAHRHRKAVSATGRREKIGNAFWLEGEIAFEQIE